MPRTIADILGCASPTNMPVEHEFFRTPWECTAALVRAEGEQLPATVWDPSCGEGHISKELERHGRNVVSTDLVDRGYGKGGIDFLTLRKPLANALVMNPPWSLAEKMVRHAAELGIDYIALLHKAHWMHAQERAVMAQEGWCPTRAYLLTWRPDFRSQRSPTIDCTWWIFERRSMRGNSWATSLLLKPLSLFARASQTGKTQQRKP